MKYLFAILIMSFGLSLTAQSETKLAIRQTQNIGLGVNSQPNIIVGRNGLSNTLLEFIADNLTIQSGTFAGNNLVTTIDNLNAAAGSVQTLTYTPGNSQLEILNGNTVDLSGLLDNTDAQDLSLSSNTLSLTGDGTSVDLSGYLDNTDAQDLSISGSTLSLTGDGSTVSLAAFLDNTDAQTLDLTGNDLTLNGDVTTVIDLSSYLDNTDQQTLSLVGSDLSITGGNTVTIPAGTDNQDLQLTGDVLSIEDGATTVDLSNYYQTVSTTGNTATFSGNNDTFSFKPVRDVYDFPLTSTEVNTHVISGVIITTNDVIKLTRNGLIQDETSDVTITNNGTDTTVTWNFTGLSTQSGIDDSVVKLFYFVN